MAIKYWQKNAKKWMVLGAISKCNSTRQDGLCNKPTGPVKNCILLSQQGYKKHLKSYTPAPAPVQELHISVTGLLKTSEIICTCIKTTRPDRIVNATNQGWGGVQDNREVSCRRPLETCICTSHPPLISSPTTLSSCYSEPNQLKLS